MAKEGSKKDQTVKLLIENSIALQGVLTNMAVSLDRLSKNMEKMLDVFKENSMAIGEDKASSEVHEAREKELINRLDSLIDQNKMIAKGIILLESTIKEKDKQRDFGF